MARPWPRWMDDLMIREYAEQFAPRPSWGEIVARTGANDRRVSPEEFLRQLARDARRTEDLATRSVDEGYTPGTNLFGTPVKTIDQGRAMGMRNLPGIENLSPEDQLALAQAIDQGAMLRAMTAVGRDPVVRRSSVPSILPNYRVTPSHRIAGLYSTERPAQFLGDEPVELGDVMAALGTKAQARRASMDPELPHPPVFGVDHRSGPVTHTPGGEIRVSPSAEALGPDIAELARQVRRDQIDSRVLSVQEAADALAQQELNAAMAASADDVARMEARLRAEGPFPAETVAQMDRANRQRDSLMSGQTERLMEAAYESGDPLKTIARRALEKDPDPNSWQQTQSYSDWWDKNEGKDILKGLALGHVLAYPAVYGIIKATHPEWFGNTDLPEVPAEPARQLAEYAEEEERAWRARPENALPEPPAIQDPDLPLVPMSVGNMGLKDDPIEDMTFAEENVAGAPAMDELDAELVAAGMQPAATSRGDISSMRVNGQLVDSLYPPDSVEYQMEQAYKRRTNKRPYPSLRY